MTTLRVMLRGFVAAPVVSAVAVLSLALGIGSNSAIFSLLNQVILRTLPVESPHELVLLYHPGPIQGRMSADEDDSPSFSYPMFRDLQRDQSAFAGLAGSRTFAASLSWAGGEPTRGSVRLISGNYFPLLGVRPALGRLIGPEDDVTVGGHPVVVLGHAYWTTRFGANPAVLNTPALINGHSLTIVGVAAAGFRGERLGGDPEVYVPLAMKPQMTPGNDGTSDRRDYWVTMFARLKPGDTIERATTAINVTYAAGLEQDAALLNNPSAQFLQRFRAKKILLKPGAFGRGGLREDSFTPMTLLFAVTGTVLLIACANVANLLLARAIARSREITVRLAIGASRGQIVRQLLGESILLALTGGLAGLFFAWATLRFIIASVPPDLVGSGFLSTGLDLRVLAFSAVLSVLTGVIFGIVPALHATRPELTSTLKDQAGQTTSSSRTNRLRKSLVTAQIAVSLFLLVAAGLLGRSLVNLSRIDLGFRTDNLITFSLDPALNGYSREQTAALYERLETELAALPGATLAAASRVPAIAGDNEGRGIYVPGYEAPEDEESPSQNVVGPSYFRTLGIPLLVGREFTLADSMNAPRVAIVSESFARHYFADRNAIGQKFNLGSRQNPSADIEIVGLARNAKYSDIKETPRRVMYFPYPQETRLGAMHFYVRSSGEPSAMFAQIRTLIRGIDSTLPITDMRTMQMQIEQNLFLERMLTTLCIAFAALATLLAAIGLYGVMSYSVARRIREIGIRMALGAAAPGVRRLVLREVLWMFGIGVGIGIPLCLAGSRLLDSILYGMTGTDPLVLAGSVALLAAIATAASLIPVRRAIRTNPLQALRHE